jgi:hypothetical protein
VTEDERWNHQPVTIGQWSISGAAGAVSFKISARSIYDPALDPSAALVYYLRWGAGLLALGALLFSAPYLFRRRREILARPKKAA